MTNNDIQNTKQKTRNRVTGTLLKKRWQQPFIKEITIGNTSSAISDQLMVHYYMYVLRWHVTRLYDYIISLRGEIFDRKTNLTCPLLNKVTVSTKESERRIFLCQRYTFDLFLQFFYWILELFRQYGIFLIFVFG